MAYVPGTRDQHTAAPATHPPALATRMLMPPSRSAASFIDCSTPGRSRTYRWKRVHALPIQGSRCGLVYTDESAGTSPSRSHLPALCPPTCPCTHPNQPHIHFEGDDFATQLFDALRHPLQLFLVADVCRGRGGAEACARQADRQSGAAHK